MRYPSIVEYCNHLQDRRGRFGTLRKVVPTVDSTDELIYRASKRSVRFNVKIDGVEQSIRLFTAKFDYDQLPPNAKLLKDEILVNGQLYDLSIETPLNISYNEPQPHSEAIEDRIAVCIDGKWGYTDSLSQMVISPKYDTADEFCEGRATVSLNGLYGLIDTDGGQVIAPLYDDLCYDRSHLCYTELEGRHGVIDRTGRQIVAHQWDWTGEFSHGMLVVERDGLFGYVDINGRTIIEPQFTYASSFDHNGYATVEANGVQTVINQKNQRV